METGEVWIHKRRKIIAIIEACTINMVRYRLLAYDERTHHIDFKDNFEARYDKMEVL